MTVRVQFDVTCPAHVNLFRHAIRELARRGDAVGVTSRRDGSTTELLDTYGIAHTPLSTRAAPPLGRAVEWATRESRSLRYVRRFEPDVVVSGLRPSAVHAATLAGAGSVVVHDGGRIPRLAAATAPFVDRLCTPAYYDGDFGARHRRYEGVPELAYLHPNWFEPDERHLAEYGIVPQEPYFVLRFATTNALDDGVTRRAKQRFAEVLAAHGQVYVSNEDNLPPTFEAESLGLPPALLQHLLADASMLVTDSNATAAEAAALGTPTVRCPPFADPEATDAVEFLREYDLVISTDDEPAAIRAAADLAADPTREARWAERRRRLLSETVDLTAFLLDRIEEVGRADDRDPDGDARSSPVRPGATDLTTTH